MKNERGYILVIVLLAIVVTFTIIAFYMRSTLNHAQQERKTDDHQLAVGMAEMGIDYYRAVYDVEFVKTKEEIEALASAARTAIHKKPSSQSILEEAYYRDVYALLNGRILTMPEVGLTSRLLKESKFEKKSVTTQLKKPEYVIHVQVAGAYRNDTATINGELTYKIPSLDEVLGNANNGTSEFPLIEQPQSPIAPTYRPPGTPCVSGNYLSAGQQCRWGGGTQEDLTKLMEDSSGGDFYFDFDFNYYKYARSNKNVYLNNLSLYSPGSIELAATKITLENAKIMANKIIGTEPNVVLGNNTEVYVSDTAQFKSLETSNNVKLHMNSLTVNTDTKLGNNTEIYGAGKVHLNRLTTLDNVKLHTNSLVVSSATQLGKNNEIIGNNLLFSNAFSLGENSRIVAKDLTVTTSLKGTGTGAKIIAENLTATNAWTLENATLYIDNHIQSNGFLLQNAAMVLANKTDRVQITNKITVGNNSKFCSVASLSKGATNVFETIGNGTFYLLQEDYNTIQKWMKDSGMKWKFVAGARFVGMDTEEEVLAQCGIHAPEHSWSLEHSKVDTVYQ